MPSLKAVILCVFLLSALAGLGAQTVPEWLWAQQAGGTGDDFGEAITVDSQGNQYVTGRFQGTATFGATTLTSSGGYDIFVCKLDSAGNFLWAMRAGGTGGDGGQGISVDSSGNCYVTGYFTGSASFVDTILSSSGFTDIFVCKLDPAGNFLWAKRAGGTSIDYGYGIAVDSAGNSYVTGKFMETASFGAINIIASATLDIFVCKLDPTGNFLWAKQAGGGVTNLTGSYGNVGKAIAVDSAGNSYVAGWFEGTGSFGPTTLTSSGGADIFVCKLDPDGYWLWAKRAGGVGSTSFSEFCNSIAVDSAGNSFLTGWFVLNVRFGGIDLASSGSSDIFVCKLDTDGNFLWAIRAGGTSYDRGYAIAVDSDGNSFVKGYFYGSASFGTINLTSSGGYDFFVCKLDSAGNFLWAKKAGGAEYDYSNAIALDSAGNIYVTGWFEASASFGANTLTSNGEDDIYIVKLGVPILTAEFSSDITQGIEPLTVQFTDYSHPGQGTIINWLWIFGDGGTSTEQNPVHTYTSPGVYTVSLTVIDQNYQTDTQVQPYYITVIERVETVELNTAETLFFGSVYLEEQSGYQLVSFSNTGNVDLTLSEAHFLAEPLHFELSEPFTGMILPPGESGSLMVRFSPQAVGALYDTLFIVNNSRNLPVLKVKLSGTGLYVPPKAPLNVNVTMDGDHAVITWDAVTQNTHDQPLTPDYYFIFNSSDPYGVFGYHGSASGLQYIHPMVGAFQPRMFYRVVAYKYYRRGAGDLTALKPGMSEAEVWRVLGR